MTTPERPPPNILVILSDDQGYGDLGCMGADDLATPHLDRLAASGVLFTDFYSNPPVCSPSRAALLSGRYPAHAGVRDVLGGHLTEVGLPADVPTIASALQALGYATSLIGKWHLGVRPGFRPTDHGFDQWFGMLSGGVDYFSHINYNLWPWDTSYNPVHDLWEDGDRVWRNGEYLTEVITEQAVATLRERDRERPFFLHVAYNAPHAPMHAPARYIDRFGGLTPARRIMAAMLAALDDGIGAIVSELDRQGVIDNTFVAFFSDNGPSRHPSNWLDGSMEPYYGASAGELKGGKTSLFEGGIRVPAIVAWPDGVPAGQVARAPVAAFDLFPTILRLAGGDPDDYDLDGSDVLAVLADGVQTAHEALFWEFREQTAIRRGPWKLVLNGYEADHFPPDDPVFLANLADDIGEKRNLADDEPDMVEALSEEALDWRAGIEVGWTDEEREAGRLSSDG